MPLPLPDERDTLIALLESEWKSLEELSTALTIEEWNTPTDCPNWTVRDCLAHLIGIEHRLLGRNVQTVILQDTSHVRNEQGRKNEIDVVSRRSDTIEDILKEFRNVNSERLAVLNSQSDFQSEADSPAGKGTFADQVSVRIFDCWIHEQDIRRAVGKPGNLTGLVAELSYERIIKVMPFVFGKKVGAPEGSSARFRINGEFCRDVQVQIENGRGSLVPELSEPTTKLTMDFETFVCLSCGRWDPQMTLKDRKVLIQGDLELGTSLVMEMNYMV